MSDTTILSENDDHRITRIGDHVVKTSLSEEADSRLRHEAEVIKSSFAFNPDDVSTGENKGRFFLKIPYFDGPNGSEASPIAAIDQLPVAIILAMELQCFHTEGYVNRDIKPSNIVFPKFGSPRIIDYGCAAKIETTKEEGSVFVFGTPAYFPPEIVLRASNWDARCDIFSFGATLYYLATERMCFDATLSDELANQICTGEIAPIDSPLWPAISNCIQKIADDRYQSFGEVINDLERLSDGRQIADRSPSPEVMRARIKESNGKQFRSNFGPLTAVAASLGLALLICLGYAPSWRHAKQSPVTPAPYISLTPIRFSHSVPVQRVTLRNDSHEYEITDNSITFVVPGYYFTAFTNADTGDVFETCRYVPAVSKLDPSYGSSPNVVRSRNARWSEDEELRFAVIKGMASEEFANSAEWAVPESACPYEYAMMFCDSTRNERLPTLKELKGLKLSPRTHLFLEKTGMRSGGRPVFVSRSKAAAETIDMALLSRH